MVDMSHYEKDENLRLTKELTEYCHARGIITEAEPGRINGGEDGDEIKVIKVTKHPQFDANTLANDFAILTLAKASTKKPVRLPAVGGADIRSGSWATAMGWGITSASADAMASEKLKQLHQQILPNNFCRDVLKIQMTMSHVCAGGQRGQSPCEGDIGGPVIVADASGKGNDVLIGLIGAGGGGCGVKQGVPGIYARVSSALPWINAVIKAK